MLFVVLEMEDQSFAFQKTIQSMSAIIEYFKKHNYQSNHPKSENIDHTEFKNDIQNIVVLEMAKSEHFKNLAKFNI